MTQYSTGMRAGAIVFVLALLALVAGRTPIDPVVPEAAEVASPTRAAEPGAPAGYLSGSLAVNPRDEAQPEGF